MNELGFPFIHSPSVYIDTLEALLLYKNRMKYAAIVPEDFLPSAIFNKFPELLKEYKTAIDYDTFDKDLAINNHTIKYATGKLKELLIHSFTVTQEIN